MQGEPSVPGTEPFVGLWISQVSRLVSRLHERRLRPLGISIANMTVLSALAAGNALSQKELTTAAAVEQPTMAELLRRMERDGLVQCKASPLDKRVRLYELTHEAKRRLASAKAALVEGDHEATAGFTEEERALLVQLLRRVVGNLDASAAPQRPA